MTDSARSDPAGTDRTGTDPAGGLEPATEVFEEHRPVLTGVAYRMLGRVADAEDVVQDAWLRWSAAHPDKVEDPRAYLVRITTRLAIDRLRQVQSRREAYVGPWLPEPLLTDLGHTTPDTADEVVLAESVSLAVLVVLESLSPLERAVFVLREAFAYPYVEIAQILERAEPAVRQMAGRARAHVRERRPRFDVDQAERARLTERFLAAATAGDLAGLLGVLAPDVRLVGDGGGKAKAPVRAIESADKVGRFLLGIAKQSVPEPTVALVEVNGGPAVLVNSHGRPHTVIAVDVADGRIQAVYVLANPDKLTGMSSR